MPFRGGCSIHCGSSLELMCSLQEIERFEHALRASVAAIDSHCVVVSVMNSNFLESFFEDQWPLDCHVLNAKLITKRGLLATIKLTRMLPRSM